MTRKYNDKRQELRFLQVIFGRLSIFRHYPQSPWGSELSFNQTIIPEMDGFVSVTTIGKNSVIDERSSSYFIVG
jgi:hypothetical protein